MTGEPPQGGSAELVERLREGTHEIGMHEDNSTELFDVQGANDVMWEAADTITRLEADLVVLREALRDVLATGLNGGNNMRLAYIAAGQQALSDELLAKAEASEQAVRRAREALSGGGVAKSPVSEASP